MEMRLSLIKETEKNEKILLLNGEKLKLPIKELEETIHAASTKSDTLPVHIKLFHDLKPLKSLHITNSLKQSPKQ